MDYRRIQAVSLMFKDNDMRLSGIVGASMNNKVTCSTKPLDIANMIFFSFRFKVFN